MIKLSPLCFVFHFVDDLICSILDLSVIFRRCTIILQWGKLRLPKKLFLSGHNCHSTLLYPVSLLIGWSVQRANGQYRDHIVGQLTRNDPPTPLKLFQNISVGLPNTDYGGAERREGSTWQNGWKLKVNLHWPSQAQFLSYFVFLHYFTSTYHF